MAGVVNNSNGDVLHAAVEKISNSDPTKGEPEAARLGTMEATRHGHKNIILEGDFQKVIDELKNFPRRTDWRIHNILYVGSLRL
ncbi:hypothetical protein CJ030_MR1G002132 [Morella rubra]|uniref:RNase H type-1 domain-containing protein n=1 Tax=Morella rubra TaxID=262757 RepID=A0A6A1WQM8_9ROSI|nr:hypothetical protein CJ030_MR1G002132 [Morella rubra]